jgi:organic radical activating enzyme
MKMKVNCCDGVYNSFDVHFTSACDNRCAHCVDLCYQGLDIKKPDVQSIVSTIIDNAKGVDDVLFLGGEPCLYLSELIECVKEIKRKTPLKVYVTTAVPKICHTRTADFHSLIALVDGINLSVQHYKEDVADNIRRTTSRYDRQSFYLGLPYKGRIRINLNIVKPFLCTEDDITRCLIHYDQMGFNSIKLSEIQHGKDVYVSFSDIFRFSMGSPYATGCQSYLEMDKIIPNFNTPVLLKRSCFLCEDSLKASFTDGVKVLAKIFKPSKNNYGVIYENGSLQKGWV